MIGSELFDPKLGTLRLTLVCRDQNNSGISDIGCIENITTEKCGGQSRSRKLHIKYGIVFLLILAFYYRVV